jgi:hypothetical protein
MHDIFILTHLSELADDVVDVSVHDELEVLDGRDADSPVEVEAVVAILVHGFL